MRVIVCGSRRLTDEADRTLVYRELNRVRPSVVVQGGANGIDRLAREWAKVHKVECITFHANWQAAGAKAGPIRNSEMVAAGADLVLAFPGGVGTADCVRRARKAGLTVEEVKP